MTTRGFLAAISIGTMIAFTGLASSSAEARDYPFCIKGDYYMSAVGDCSFDTYEQCKASASGRLAWCDANPFYRPQEDDRVPYPDVRRRRFRR
ncbi:MAG: DUF3551 domain-containing protein [Rhizobiales bacterium]|nr:DUF3551 domain-containing protein [Hyphomicrobiales bacterium]